MITSNYQKRFFYREVELALQLVTYDGILRENIVQDSEDFNSLSVGKKFRKSEQLVSIMLSDAKAF